MTRFERGVRQLGGFLFRVTVNAQVEFKWLACCCSRETNRTANNMAFERSLPARQGDGTPENTYALRRLKAVQSNSAKLFYPIVRSDETRDARRNLQ